MTNIFKTRAETASRSVDHTLAAWLNPNASEHVPPKLRNAMQYSVFNGGKRIRPLLCYAAAEMIGGSDYSRATHFAAAALECIHAYSLIHDDLPAMDDDDLRRGKPTCHIKFDEATAILAGDALQTLAFEQLALLDQPALAVNLVKELALASGAGGMVGGQVLDIEAEGLDEPLELSKLEEIHKLKTGALIRAAIRMGALSAGAEPDQLSALTKYAEAVGLAFQVQDDIIDVCSDTETLGKPQGADMSRNKSTYVSLLGLCAAQDKAESLVIEAKRSLTKLPGDSTLLCSIADFIIDRRN